MVLGLDARTAAWLLKGIVVLLLHFRRSSRRSTPDECVTDGPYQSRTLGADAKAKARDLKQAEDTDDEAEDEEQCGWWRVGARQGCVVLPTAVLEPRPGAHGKGRHGRVAERAEAQKRDEDPTITFGNANSENAAVVIVADDAQVACSAVVRVGRPRKCTDPARRARRQRIVISPVRRRAGVGNEAICHAAKSEKAG